MKIAVTTSDGLNVDGHFGRGGCFYIFRKTSNGIDFLETRTIHLKNHLNNLVDDDQNFQVVYNIIKDCNAVYTANIDNERLRLLNQKGIITYLYEGDINDLVPGN
jgi:predicted Fe-Mo cluster-binding NifX family protein